MILYIEHKSVNHDFGTGFYISIHIMACVELLVSHWVPPRVADRGMPARYGGYWGNKIPGADQNQYRCLAADRGICKG